MSDAGLPSTQPDSETAVSDRLDPSRTLLAWWPIALGMLLLFVPTFIELSNGIWKTDRNAHGPIVLAVSLWFLFFRTKQLLLAKQIQPGRSPILSVFLLGLGLSCYVIGRSQSVYFLEVGALIPLLAGCVTTFFGAHALRKLWFAFFFMLFFIPLPATVVDAMTQPMKIGVSYAVEHLLYWLGYPIARTGVILILGQYQLLVADACAGLHSLFTLEALGLLYMNLVNHTSVVRNAVLAVLIVPISFASNVVRVLTLALITYHMGDAAGQGFLHGFAGMMLFLSALLLIISVDTVLGVILDRRASRPMADAASKSEDKPVGRMLYARLGIPRAPSMAVGAGMLLAVGLALALTPERQPVGQLPDLEAMIPRSFAGWREVPSPYAQITLAAEGELDDERPYDAVLMRTYVDGSGAQVMLALAYSRNQHQEVKIHRPEVCYESQGFAVLAANPVDFASARGGKDLPGMRLVARSGNRIEAVSYWIRIGENFSRSSAQARWFIFRDGLNGKVPDGMLVRVSTVQGSMTKLDDAYAAHGRFLRELVDALPREAGPLLVASR